MEHMFHAKYLGWYIVMVFDAIIKNISAISWGSVLLEDDKPYTGRAVIRRLHVGEKQLLTCPEHLTSPIVFRRVRVVQSLVFCVVFYRSLLSHFVPFVLLIITLSLDWPHTITSNRMIILLIVLSLLACVSRYYILLGLTTDHRQLHNDDYDLSWIKREDKAWQLIAVFS
jgi:hypothetical protein